MSDDVAIVGIGMHPFGRHDGVTGMEQGAVAIRNACADAGVEWGDLQFAFGGSTAAGAADTIVSQMGLTGLQFINVVNGCATGGSALISAYNTIRSGAFDLGIAIGFDKHEQAPFEFSQVKQVSETGTAAAVWLLPLSFGMKINRYMEQYRICRSSLAKVASKAFRNGSMNENVAPPASSEGSPSIGNVVLPVDPVHVLLPRRGRRGADPGSRRSSHKYTDKPIS